MNIESLFNNALNEKQFSPTPWDIPGQNEAMIGTSQDFNGLSNMFKCKKKDFRGAASCMIS